MKRLDAPNHINRYLPMFLGSVLFLCFYTSLSAQQKVTASDNPEAQKKIEDLKAAYLTRQLNLSPQEAQKFWPVYNQYQHQMEDLANKRRQNLEARNHLNNASDQQVDQSLDQDFRLQQRALQLREQYRKRFGEVIPSKKVMQLYKSEKDFNMKLIQQLQQRNNGADGHPARTQTRPRQRPMPSGNTHPARVRSPNTRPGNMRPQTARPANRSSGHARRR